MKGRIFIAWSGDNTLAFQVKKKVEIYNYTGTVGGEQGTTHGLYVGHTVLDEIQHCNQAIFLIQKKEDGTISSNVLFELGYSLARFSSNKIHVFYIDINPDDEQIPSDLKGMWASYYKTAEKENLVEEIVNQFLSAQKYIIQEDKMSVVDNYYSVKKIISFYHSSPQCSEYELAQYVLFFGQSAYMFNTEKESLAVLQNLSRTLHNPSDRLLYSIQLSSRYMECLLSIKKTGNLIFLEKSDFRTINRLLMKIANDIIDWEEDDFTLWFNTVLYNTINYSHILHATNPNTEDNKRQKILIDSLVFAKKCLDFVNKLLENPSNRHFAELYKAYMYRNIATAYGILSASTEVISDNLNQSYKMREKLWYYYRETKNINTKLLEKFEMEYYLSLSEVLEYTQNDIVREDIIDECEEYLERIRLQRLDKSFYIQKIEASIAKY